jgi:hypothetical protein
VVWTQGKAEWAVRLLAAAAGLREELSSSLHPLERPAIDRTVEALRLVLDEATFDQAWADGQALPLELVIKEALDSGVKDALSATATNERTPA